MDKPVCRLCRKKHWAREGCGTPVASGGGTPTSVSQKGAVVSQKEMANAMANTYRYRDVEKRKAYQRVLMQLRRALAGGRACAWPR